MALPPPAALACLGSVILPSIPAWNILMSFNRRQFLRTSAAAGVSLSAGSWLSHLQAAPSAVTPRSIAPNDKLNVLVVGVIGTIGAKDRKEVASHPNVRIAGLC